MSDNMDMPLEIEEEVEESKSVKAVKIKPLGLNIVVTRDETENFTPGGLHIPTNCETKSQWGKVISVGDLVDGVTEGDRVMFGKYDGIEIELEGLSLLILEEDEIFGVEEDA